MKKSEPARLCGLKKQVTEAKKGGAGLELTRKKGKDNMPGGRRGRKGRTCSRDRTPGERMGGKGTGVLRRENQPTTSFLSPSGGIAQLSKEGSLGEGGFCSLFSWVLRSIGS